MFSTSLRDQTRFAILVFALFGGLIPSASAAEEPAKSVAALLTDHDRRLTHALLSYIETHPKAVDLDQAYLALFNKVIEYDWFTEFEKPAMAYLKASPDGPINSLARIVTTMARAQLADFPEALKRYEGLMQGLGKPEQEEFAANFADSFANVATAAGAIETSRQIYQTLLKQYPDSPELKQKTFDDLNQLDKVGKPSPEIVANDIKGDPFRLANVKGKYVLIDFWATWCAPWVADLERLEATYARFRPRGFEIIGVNLDDSKEALLDFIKARNVNWRQIHNPTCGGDVVEAFGVGTVPATFLIDPNGTLIRLEVRGKALDQILEELLPASNPAETPKQAKP